MERLTAILDVSWSREFITHHRRQGQARDSFEMMKEEKILKL